MDGLNDDAVICKGVWACPLCQLPRSLKRALKVGETLASIGTCRCHTAVPLS